MKTGEWIDIETKKENGTLTGNFAYNRYTITANPEGDNLIEFTINGATCTAEEGMTMYDWVVSDYNTSSWSYSCGLITTGWSPEDENGGGSYHTGCVYELGTNDTIDPFSSVIKPGAIYTGGGNLYCDYAGMH